MNLDFDLHLHTFHSPCGQSDAEPAEIVRLAAERGMSRIAFTDHWYTFTDFADVESVRAEAIQAKRKLDIPMQIYFGCEAEVMSPGSTAGSAELAEKLDFIMAGVTHFVNKGVTDLPEGDDEFHASYFLEMFKFGVSLPWVDVIAHPFMVFPSVCSPSLLKFLKDSDLLPAIEIAKQNNVAMEISRRVFHTPEQLPFSLHFLHLCKQAGLKFTMGSDAHQLKDVSQMHLLKPVIEELELTERDFWFPTPKYDR